MQIVFLTALGVGGATVVGAVIGFVFQAITRTLCDVVLAFSAGVMLAAAILGLILPSLEYEGRFPLLITVAGIFAGAVTLSLLEGFTPQLQRLAGLDTVPKGGEADGVLLFVAAIAIHNLPEGLAAGVSFGTDSVNQAILIAGSIALQNIPEGMVIIAPMLAAGISPRRTLIIGLATGLIEVVGTLLGYFAVTIVTAILPFALAFAGGTMLYVISEEMIPQSHSSYPLLGGFCLMLVCDALLGG